jgi:hypothetical protein
MRGDVPSPVRRLFWYEVTLSSNSNVKEFICTSEAFANASRTVDLHNRICERPESHAKQTETDLHFAFVQRREPMCRFKLGKTQKRLFRNDLACQEGKVCLFIVSLQQLLLRVEPCIEIGMF